MPPKTELTHITHASPKNLAPEEIPAWKDETYQAYSHPFPARTIFELQKEFPKGEKNGPNFIVDSGKDRRIFDKDGREIIHEWYDPTLVAQKNPFSVLHRITSTYDTDGFISYMSEMQLGKVGYTASFVYENSKSGKILDRVILCDVDRQGTMSPGLPISQEIIMFK